LDSYFIRGSKNSLKSRAAAAAADDSADYDYDTC
jgi:hypothetical protein